MKTSFAIVLLCALLAAVCYADSSESSESSKCHKQRESCHELFQGGDSSSSHQSSHESSHGSSQETSVTIPSSSGMSGWGSGNWEASGSMSGSMEGSASGYSALEGTKCVLIESFKNMTSLLSGADITIWLEFVEELQIEVVEDDSFTDDMKMTMCGAKLKAFFALHASIKIALQFQMIGDWGMCADVQKTCTIINSETSESTITMTDTSDMGCPLIAGMLNYTKSHYGMNTATYNLTLQFVESLKSQCLLTSMSTEDMQAYLSVQFKLFFSQHPELEAEFRSIEIGDMTIDGLLDVCDVYEKAKTVTTIFPSTKGSSSCPMIDGMTAAMNNASFNFTRSQKTSLSDFISLISSYLVSFSGDFSVELSYVEHLCYEFQQANSWSATLFSQIQIGSWGSMDDFQFCQGFSGSFYGSSMSSTKAMSSTMMSSTMSSKMMSSTMKPSTMSGSSMKSSTMMPTTATPSKCSMSAMSNLITPYNMTTGNTSLIDSINYAMTFWSARQVSSFSPMVQKCQIEIASTTDSMSVKISQCQSIFSGYCSGDSSKTALVFGIFITVHQTGANYGTIGDFCGCANSTTTTKAPTSG